MKTIVRTLAILATVAICGASVAKADSHQPQPQPQPQADDQWQVFVNPDTGEAVKVSEDGMTIIPLDKSKITVQKGSGENLVYPYRGWGRGWGHGWGRGWGRGWYGRGWYGHGWHGHGWHGRRWWRRGWWYPGYYCDPYNPYSYCY